MQIKEKKKNWQLDKTFYYICIHVLLGTFSSSQYQVIFLVKYLKDHHNYKNYVVLMVRSVLIEMCRYSFLNVTIKVITSWNFYFYHQFIMNGNDEWYNIAHE